MRIALSHISKSDNLVMFCMNIMNKNTIELYVNCRFWRRDSKCTWMFKYDNSIYIGDTLRDKIYDMLKKEGHL